MRCALVRIDRMKLAMRLFRALGHWPDDLELRQWLEENGLAWVGGSWFSCQGSPAALEPDEILEEATTELSDGITFVDRRPAPQGDRRGVSPPPSNHSEPAS